MNVLIAIDSFKGSLSSTQLANAIEEGIFSVDQTINVKKMPIADGGEGTVTALTEALNGKIIETIVHDPLMRKITAEYGLLPNQTAVIEMAQASGLPLLQPHEWNPLYTTTYGLGDLIKDALKHQVKTIIIGIGGSATNDAGIGMLASLGYQFYDADNNKLEPIGLNLRYIHKVDTSLAIKLPEDLTIIVACDVNNPLYGPNGAAHIFGPQKGANEESVHLLDQGLKHYASYIYNIESIDLQKIKGTGAAGGLPASLVPYLKATLKPGIEIIFDLINIESHIKAADLIITGEGKIDHQTLMDKAPMGIINYAKKYQKEVIVLTGNLTEEGKELLQYGVKIYNINENSFSQDYLNPSVAFKNTKNTIINLFKAKNYHLK